MKQLRMKDITKANAIYIFDGNRHAFILYVGDKAFTYTKVTFRVYSKRATIESGTTIPIGFQYLSRMIGHYRQEDSTIIPFELTEEELTHHILLETI